MIASLRRVCGCGVLNVCRRTINDPFTLGLWAWEMPRDLPLLGSLCTTRTGPCGVRRSNDIDYKTHSTIDVVDIPLDPKYWAKMESASLINVCDYDNFKA